jgi:Flp pilus assembly protein TadB
VRVDLSRSSASLVVPWWLLVFEAGILAVAILTHAFDNLWVSLLVMVVMFGVPRLWWRYVRRELNRQS